MGEQNYTFKVPMKHIEFHAQMLKEQKKLQKELVKIGNINMIKPETVKPQQEEQTKELQKVLEETQKELQIQVEQQKQEEKQVKEFKFGFSE